MIPKEFFVTGGKATSRISELNAFDLALKEAGIAQCNLVYVSSIIPPGCEEVELRPIPVGAITYVVMSRMDGKGEEKIGAGVAWSFGRKKGYGIVAEAHGCFGEKEIRKVLESRIHEMAKTRSIEVDRINYRIETLNVPSGSYGCVIAALVYL